MFDACLRALELTFANVSFFVPYFHRYSRPAPPNICAVGGAWEKPCVSNMTLACLPIGLSRSSHLDPRAPFSIFSKPSARAHSTAPPSTACLASISAVDPVEQLLFTLNTGTPVSPTSYAARCPQVLSPYTKPAYT